MTALPSTVDEILSSRKIVVTCGTGGVGKTTLSAALGLRAAALGKHVLVITVDPAKRLATSLGLESLGNEPVDLTARLRERHPDLKGTFSAVMPDPQKVFEEFVWSISPTEALAERVLNNPIFRIFSREFSGANEYMAIERLHTFAKQGRYDCIVLDTPPSRNALALLDAPEMLLKFFDEKLIQWLVVPANKLIGEAMKKAFGLLERLTGQGFLTHLVDFAKAIFEVQHKFAANLRLMRETFRTGQAGFLLVTTPRFDNAADLEKFIARLDEREYHFDGLAINRSLAYLKASDAKAPPLVAALQAQEAEALKRLKRDLSARIVTRLPELARDVHSLEDLWYVANAFSK